LGGDLPCVVCRYNLRGLSVLTACPECGTNIRATVLAVVDPDAEELRPLVYPWLNAFGVVALVLGGVLAAVGLWVPRVMEGFGVWVLGGGVGTTGGGVDGGWAVLVYVGLWMSFLGVFGVVRLHRDDGLWRRSKVLLGALLLVGLGLVLHAIVRRDAAYGGPGYLGGSGGVWGGGGPDSIDVRRVMLRILSGALLIGVILLVRSNLRALVARSMVLRSGRVDRQTLLAIAAAAGVGMVGDVLRLLSAGALEFGGDAGGVVGRTGLSQWFGLVGTMVVFVGSALVTLGLMGALIDSLRIAMCVLRPGPSLTELLGEADGVVEAGSEIETGGDGVAGEPERGPD